MSDLYGRPSAVELVQAVRELLADLILPTVAPEHAYQLRVALNALGMVERELGDGHAEVQRHAERLSELGFADSAAWSAAIRSGTDTGYDQALADVEARLRVASPQFVARYE